MDVPPPRRCARNAPLTGLARGARSPGAVGAKNTIWSLTAAGDCASAVSADGAALDLAAAFTAAWTVRFSILQLSAKAIRSSRSLARPSRARHAQ
jgi:hypothetical protein